MQTLVGAARNVITRRQKLAEVEAVLFYDHRAELYCKLREIAFHMCRGKQEPETCGESESILFAIKDFTDEEFDLNKYPASCIKWDTYYLNNTLQIEAGIEAFFRCEQDAAICIVFPVNEDEYSMFIKGLNQEACAREAALDIKAAKEKALAEEAEKKTLAALLQKYGS